MMLSSYTSSLVEDTAGILLYDTDGKLKPFFEMLKEIRNAHFDAAVIAYPRFRIALLLKLAGIPLRIGTGYRWYSFLFNKRIYEHRKTVEKHEAEYNLSLLQGLGIKISHIPEAKISISQHEKRTASDIRQSLGISETDNMILLHPGSGRSARDWKPERFARLAGELAKSGYKVVITGGLNEEVLVNRTALEAGSNVKPFISRLNLKEFAAFIQTAKLFIANSTGPLHIAAAVGTPVIGFYPPVRVMSEKRWGPMTDKKIIFVPDPALCPRCKGGSCRGSDCMDQISVDQVVDAKIKLIRCN
ncbi:MAG: glycosyltransferase family 9 protein [Bacteroidetes bacterium]|nr:glycosyltransferase family 9 protein [Bacteroidota bacterium]